MDLLWWGMSKFKRRSRSLGLNMVVFRKGFGGI